MRNAKSHKQSGTEYCLQHCMESHNVLYFLPKLYIYKNKKYIYIYTCFHFTFEPWQAQNDALLAQFTLLQNVHVTP